MERQYQPTFAKAKANNNYQHYAQFRKALAQQPLRLIMMFNKYGSERFKTSEYFSLCKLMNIITNINYFVFTLATSSFTVFALTFLLHTRRAWVLSTAGPLRSITCKYLPIWLVWSAVEYDSKPKIAADVIQSDFGQIENQFWRVYSEHKYDSTFKLLL